MTFLHWRSRLLLSLALGYATVAGHAQQAGTPTTHTLSGQVVDSVSGQPIARALVQIGNEQATLTDHDGNFTFTDAQQNFAFASKPGYFPEEGGGQMLNEGSTTLLRLTPEAILYGTVTDTNSQPIEHLQVQLRQLQVRNGLSHWQQMQAATTNAEGEFRFAELAAGKYSLSTGFQLDGLPNATSSLAFVPILYPPPGSESASGGVTLHAGEHVEANLSPPSDKLYTVSGAIPAAFTRSINFEVETREGLPVSPALRVFPDTGIFRLRLPSGAYRITVRSTLEAQQFYGAREISVGQAPLEGVSIAFAPLPSIPVEVEYQQVRTPTEGPAEPPQFVNIMLADDEPGRSFGMLPAQRVQNTGNDNRAPQPGDPLVIKDVPPGRYVLQAQTQSPWYVASASCGNVDLTRELLVVGNGSAACSVRVVLRNDAGTLKWSMVRQNENDGRPERQVIVMAFPLANLTQSATPSNSRSNSNQTTAGSFDMMSPGRYLVIASPHTLDVPYRDPVELQKYLQLGQEVGLTPNGEAEIQLQLAPGEP